MFHYQKNQIKHKRRQNERMKVNKAIRHKKNSKMTKRSLSLSVTTLNVNELNSPIKDKLAEQIKIHDPTACYL